MKITNLCLGIVLALDLTLIGYMIGSTQTYNQISDQIDKIVATRQINEASGSALLKIDNLSTFEQIN